MDCQQNCLKVEEMKDLIENIWEKKQRELPSEWNIGILCPLHKRGDLLECCNYRGITLLNVAYKILSNILYARLQPFVERSVGEHEAGFRQAGQLSFTFLQYDKY
jgi:hypothetical protein